eukprot:1133971-Prorocentrum_minimum.AAC.1
MANASFLIPYTFAVFVPYLYRICTVFVPYLCRILTEYKNVFSPYVCRTRLKTTLLGTISTTRRMYTEVIALGRSSHLCTTQRPLFASVIQSWGPRVSRLFERCTPTFARSAFGCSLRETAADQKEERMMLLEAWRAFETRAGSSPEALEAVTKKMPRYAIHPFTHSLAHPVKRKPSRKHARRLKPGGALGF